MTFSKRIPAIALSSLGIGLSVVSCDTLTIPPPDTSQQRVLCTSPNSAGDAPNDACTAYCNSLSGMPGCMGIRTITFDTVLSEGDESSTLCRFRRSNPANGLISYIRHNLTISTTSSSQQLQAYICSGADIPTDFPAAEFTCDPSPDALSIQVVFIDENSPPSNIVCTNS